MKNKLITIKVPYNSLIPTPDKASKGFKAQSHLSCFSPDSDKSPLPIGDILKAKVVSKKIYCFKNDSSSKKEFRPRANAFIGTTPIACFKEEISHVNISDSKQNEISPLTSDLNVHS